MAIWSGIIAIPIVSREGELAREKQRGGATLTGEKSVEEKKHGRKGYILRERRSIETAKETGGMRRGRNFAWLAMIVGGKPEFC